MCVCVRVSLVFGVVESYPHCVGVGEYGKGRGRGEDKNKIKDAV